MEIFRESEVQDGRQVTVYSDHGYPVGFGIVSLTSGELVLETLHVDPPYRRCGLGGVMLEQLIAWGTENGAHTLTGDFKPEFGEESLVRPFYERKGIEITRTGQLFKKLQP